MFEPAHLEPAHLNMFDLAHLVSPTVFGRLLPRCQGNGLDACGHLHVFKTSIYAIPVDFILLLCFKLFLCPQKTLAKIMALL